MTWVGLDLRVNSQKVTISKRSVRDVNSVVWIILGTLGASSRSRHLSDKSEVALSSTSSDLEETDLKNMLSSLVHEANFLVEDNLCLLMEEDDITEGERNLFKLDSILTAIGLQGEKALFKVLKQHEKNPSKVFLLYLLECSLYLRFGFRKIRIALFEGLLRIIFT